MTERVDGYLSRHAQEIWPTALVMCRVEDGKEEWFITGRKEDSQELPDLGLGDSFGRARDGIRALLRARGEHDV